LLIVLSVFCWLCCLSFVFKLFFTIREEICTNKDIIFSATIFIEVAVSNQEISRSVYTC
jgi:hypothetical protein